MNDTDDGYFHYDNNYPPMFVQCPEQQQKACKDVMRVAIMGYLRSSHQDGLKHHNAILDCGMSAGEAAVNYLRESKDGAATQ